MKPKLMFYCQHVLGMGHLVRSRELVKGLSGFDVCFVNGGEPVDGFAFPATVRLVQLPPIASDEEFRAIDANDETRRQRREVVLDLFTAFQPDVLIVEMFPFGRRKFAFELLPMLERNAASGRRTHVVSSVRDILVSKRDQQRHEEFACRMLNEHFDLVLVHSDPQFQRLEDSFFRAADIQPPVVYTGFVAEQPAGVLPQRNPSAVPHIIASIGGGRVGGDLLSATIEASTRLGSPHRLTVFTGPYHDDQQVDALRAKAMGAPWIEIERFASNFVDRLAQADLSISMAGYNTCMNIVAAGIRSLVLPFSGNANEEQTVRARKLQALGALRMLSPADLEPNALAETIRQSLAVPLPGRPALNCEGVIHTAKQLERLVPVHV